MSKRKPQLNLAVSQETLDLIERLKVEFGVETSTAVLKRELAVSRLIVDNRRDDHTITLIGRDEKKKDIVING